MYIYIYIYIYIYCSFCIKLFIFAKRNVIETPLFLSDV